MNHSPDTLLLRQLGLRDYLPVYEAMQRVTAARTPDSPDELWLVEHPPVFTQGRNGKAEHLLDPGQIPVIEIDRGGQVTYHGPGQLVVYALLDLPRRKAGVRELVTALEQSVIELLAGYGIQAEARSDAPGVYVDGAKIASLGLRVKRGRSYHGLSLNVDMDLAPFSRINPCGYQGLAVTKLRDLGIDTPYEQIAAQFCTRLSGILGYNALQILDSDNIPDV
ncbi:MAG: lipoyl(octanoyl) transferase LipB [Granulosicoccaceae bacterium]